MGTEPNDTGSTRSRRGRAALATVLIVLAALLTPVALAASWSRAVLSDTDAVVATLAPLAQDTRLQVYLADQVSGVLQQRVDTDAMVNRAFDGLAAELEDRPRAQGALNALRQPAADGVRAALENAVTEAVASDTFAQAWQQALRISHAQAVAVLQGDPDRALTVESEGLGLRLGPLVARVQQQLVERGFDFLARIPPIERTVVLVESEYLVRVQAVYGGAVAAGAWLPWVAAALLGGGVLVAVRRRRATVWAALGLGAGALAVLAAVAYGRASAQANVPAATMPPDVLQLFYDTLLGGLREPALATLLLAAVVGAAAAAAAWRSRRRAQS